MTGPAPITHLGVLARVWPLAIANAATPLAGVVDTAVIGATGSADDLAGVALGAAIITVVIWSLYFLRMGTTGLAAQADGAGDPGSVVRVLVRSAVLALGLGLATAAAGGLIASVGFAVMADDAGLAGAQGAGRGYVIARAAGAPGALLAFALTGWLIGIGRAQDVMWVSVAFSAVNIALDLVFVVGFGWGATGVGAATAIADVTGAAMAAVLVARALRRRGGTPAGALDRSRLLNPAKLVELVVLSGDLMVRNWALTGAFAWFAAAGAALGPEVVAGNHVLLQTVVLWAFVLDAIAFVTEAEVGRAVGGRNPAALSRAITVTTQTAAGCGLVFAAITALGGGAALDAVIADPDVRASAHVHLLWAAVIPLIGVLAWQLDGVFIGAAKSAAMRNAAVAATAGFIALEMVITPRFGGHGLWFAMTTYFALRGLTLAVALPRVYAAAR